ncbi:MAG: CpXC domain-containing protein [Chloroflexi bacterium]|nr:CpXC domain-containing protein [Chloroflexota bacterium]
MPKIQTSCPRCRQPILAEVQQLFDATTDPTAKQRLLSRSTNTARCQACGYEGMMSTPIVYHDPEKELLLTFFPPEIGLPVTQQEKQIGPMINQVVNSLPAEKRKGYLFQPQTMFTYQTLIDRILQADGITKEMIDAQQKRVNLIQRLLSTPKSEDRSAIIQQEKALVDGGFFAILSTIMESASQQADEKTTQLLAEVQQQLLQETEIGKDLLAQSVETQAALKTLQEASKTGLTRETLLDILAGLKSDSSLTTVVSLTRSGMDYQFFQVLSERIEKDTTDQKQKLIDLRDKLLNLTREIDAEMQKRLGDGVKLLDSILNEPNLEEAVKKHLPEMDEFFSQAVQSEFEAAHKKGDMPRIENIQKVISMVEKESAPPPEVELIQKLLSSTDEAARLKILAENAAMVTEEFLQAINSIIAEGEARKQSPELLDGLRSIYKQALRFTMEKNLGK